MANTIKIAVAAISLAPLAGCTTSSPNMAAREQSMRKNISMIYDKTGNESAAQALARYSGFLAANPIRDFGYYNRQLVKQLESLKGWSGAVLSPDSILGLQRTYHIKLAAVIDTHCAMARIYAEQAKYKQAEKSYASALRLAHDKATTRYFMAKYSAGILNGMRKLYKRSGSTGKALAAKFSESMLNDYIYSRQGGIDFALEQQMTVESYHQRRDADAIVRQINRNRASEDTNDFLKTIELVGSIASAPGLDSSASKAGDAIKIAKTVGALSGTAATANYDELDMKGIGISYKDLTIAEQLADPEMGTGTKDIILSFASSAKELADPAVTESAEKVKRLAVDLDRLRTPPIDDDSLTALRKLAAALEKLRGMLNR